MFVKDSGRLNSKSHSNEISSPVHKRLKTNFLEYDIQENQKQHFSYPPKTQNPKEKLLNLSKRSELFYSKHMHTCSTNKNASPTNISKRYQQELQEQEFRQQRYFNNPQIQELAQEAKDLANLEKLLENDRKNNEKMESCERNASATTKALSQMEFDGADKKKWKKSVKIPMALKRKKLNQRLSKILTPKSALILLHELKPDCVYNVQEQLGTPPVFSAQVDLDGKILGKGQGSSKSQAKNSAAENAIKNIVTKTMSRDSGSKEGEVETEEEQSDTPENLPWAGLASFAIYKMFNEWQNQGTDLPIAMPPLKKKIAKSGVNAPTKKDLPPNAIELHPAVVLNMVNPGLTAIELERDDAPKCRVKMAYMIQGKTFTGVGGNKKDAKKEAAKAVLEGLYGLSYR